LREEIVTQINQFPDWTGKFIIPVPDPVVLDSRGHPIDE
jgi:hypothetical protein